MPKKTRTLTIPIAPQRLNIGTIETIVTRVVEEVTGQKHNVIVTQSKDAMAEVTIISMGGRDKLPAGASIKIGKEKEQ